MKVFVYANDNTATLVAEGSPEEEGMSDMPHLRREAEHECETIDEGIEWFRRWCTIHLLH